MCRSRTSPAPEGPCARRRRRRPSAFTIRRTQFPPGLLPIDCAGRVIDQPSREEFEFRPSPVSINILIADETDRAAEQDTVGACGCRSGTAGHGRRKCTRAALRAPRSARVTATENPIETRRDLGITERIVDAWPQSTNCCSPPMCRRRRGSRPQGSGCRPRSDSHPTPARGCEPWVRHPGVR